MKYSVLSKRKYLFTQSRKNEKGLVASFRCSRAPEPCSQGAGEGGGTAASWEHPETLGRGRLQGNYTTTPFLFCHH